MRRDRVAEREQAASLFDREFGYEAVAARLEVPKGTARKWLYTYRALGKEALLVTKHKTYSHDLKVAAAKAVIEGSMTKPEAMEEFGIGSITALERWCRLYRDGGPDALLPKPKGRPKRTAPVFPSREEELEARVQELELENEILKRFHALAEEIERRRQTR